jgi:hypothetical protein
LQASRPRQAPVATGARRTRGCYLVVWCAHFTNGAQRLWGRRHAGPAAAGSFRTPVVSFAASGAGVQHAPLRPPCDIAPAKRHASHRGISMYALVLDGSGVRFS